MFLFWLSAPFLQDSADEERLRKLGAALAQAWRGEATRRGLRVLLLGPPNSGKSSLLNVLAGEEVALVSPDGHKVGQPFHM